MNTKEQHPVDRLADVLGGRDRVVLAWVVTLLVAIVVTPDGSTIGAVGVLAVLLGGGYALADRGREQSRKERDLVDAQTRYVEGDLNEREFERELELILDDENRKIRQTVMQADDVGEVTSANVAIAFRSLDALRSASIEALQEVPGIGQSRAEAIKTEVGR